MVIDPKNFVAVICSSLFCCFLFVACGEGDSALHHESLIEKLNESNAPNKNGNLSSETHLETENRISIEGIEAGKDVYVENRTGNITQYPCSECHDRPIAQMQAGKQPGLSKAHWQIKIAHAPSATMNCFTCHNDVRINELQSLTGAKITFDHSYQLCAQCHSRQKMDWIGGAHGKRVGGWAPPRVIQSCVQCHDPHQPALEKRWPTRTQ